MFVLVNKNRENTDKENRPLRTNRICDCKFSHRSGQALMRREMEQALRYLRHNVDHKDFDLGRTLHELQ